MDYLRQITDLINTAKDAAETLTAQAEEIETLTVELHKAENARERAIDLLQEADREADVLETERDNALLRIEELETELDWARPFVEIERPDDKGGVNPNA